MTLVSKNVYIDKLDDIVNEYNNTYHNTNKMKLADVKSSAYIEFNQENNKKDPKPSVVIWTYVISNLNGEEIIGT